MSLEQYIFCDKDCPPVRAQWQAAIDEMGFDMQLDPEMDLTKDSGFSPSVLKGNVSGFEIYFEDASEYIDALPEFRDAIGDRTAVITQRWGGDEAELTCVLIAAAAAIKAFKCVVIFPDEDAPETIERLVNTARQCYDDL